jgi:hypothetical protein
MAAFGEIETIAYCASHSIIIPPYKKVRTDSTLHDAIFNEMAYLIIDKRRDNRCAKTKTLPEPTCNVVFSATLPGMKLSCSSDTTLSRIKPKHHLA